MGCDYTHNSFCVYISYRFNPRTIKGATFFSCPILKSDGSILIHAPALVFISNLNILIHAPVRGATSVIGVQHQTAKILIHAPVRGATAKSHKIDSDFAVLFRKFIQKLGIAIFTISIFLEKQEQYFLFL